MIVRNEQPEGAKSEAEYDGGGVRRNRPECSTMPAIVKPKHYVYAGGAE
jgi:hypothetical protein